MARRVQEKINCECCTLRSAKTRYSKQGNLCDKCDKHHYNKGNIQQEYQWESQPNYGRASPIRGARYTQCFCCEISFLLNAEDTVEIEFECRKDKHNVYVCLNCGEGQIRSMKCTKDNTKPLRSSATELEEKRQDKIRRGNN